MMAIYRPRNGLVFRSHSTELKNKIESELRRAESDDDDDAVDLCVCQHYHVFIRCSQVKYNFMSGVHR